MHNIMFSLQTMKCTVNDVYNDNRESCTCCAVYNRNMPCRKEQDLVVFMCDINVGWSFGVDIVGMETCMFIMAT